jgi:two-component system, OmpR family, sensor histidine kinase BaeS
VRSLTMPMVEGDPGAVGERSPRGSIGGDDGRWRPPPRDGLAQQVHNRHVFALGPLGRRLAVAFVVVAAVALGTVVTLADRTVREQTGSLDHAERARAERRIVRALADAYATAGSWELADLTAARVLAQAAGLHLVVVDAAGAGVATVSPEPDREPEPEPDVEPAPDPSTDEGTDAGPGTTGGTGAYPAMSGASGVTAPAGGHSAAGPATGRRGTAGPATGTGAQAGKPSAVADTGPRARSSGSGPSRTAGGNGQAGSAAGNAARSSGGTNDVSGRSGRGSGVLAQHPAVDWVHVAATAEATPGAQVSGAPVSGAGLPVVVDGRVVGRAIIASAPGTVTPVARARDAILQAVDVAAAGAVIVSIVLALFVAGRITRPLAALADAAAAVERGDPAAAALLRPGPGELGEVSRAFAQMAQALRRADEVRRALTADISHELRTPVAVLRGVAEEVLDGVAPLTLDTVRSLHEEALRLERLVEDLAALSAAQAAGLRMLRLPLDLRDVVGRTVDALRPRFVGAGQRLVVRLPAGPATIRGDAMRLEQVVTNLLTNAHAYAPDEGRVLVEVVHDVGNPARVLDPGEADAEMTARPGPGCWTMRVSDSGPGIPPEDLPHVFRRFYRGHGSERRAGSGIGLAVVAELVAAHGGTVDVASPPGQGATFTVTLPAARHEPAADAVLARS